MDIGDPPSAAVKNHTVRGFFRTFICYVLKGNLDAHRPTLSNTNKDLRYLEKIANGYPC